MIQTLSTAFSMAVGVCVLIACFFFLQRLKLKRWEWFSRRFGKLELPEHLARKTFGTFLISDVKKRELWATGYHKYPPVRVALHAEGVSFAIMPPFGLAMCPILIPYDGLRIEPTIWGDMAGEIVAISHDRLPDAYIIGYKDIGDWIEAHRPADTPAYRPRVEAFL